MTTYLIGSLSESGPALPRWFGNHAFVCPTCGELWARVWVAADEWRGYTFPCAKCPPWPLCDSVPGSVLEILGGDNLDYLPPAVLRRELAVHLAAERTQ